MTEEARSSPAPAATSLSEDSTERLINQKQKELAKSEGSDGKRRLVVWLGLSQVALGALLVCCGALGVVRGAALARAGAGLWAGCVAVVAGVVGVLAGINDCYGLPASANSGAGSGLLTSFLALSLLSLACGNGAAVLAATGLQRDARRAHAAPAPTLDSFQDEMDAWSPVLTNIALLIVACAHCIVSVASIYHVARRVCSCFRPRRAFDHNQFEPDKPYLVTVEKGVQGLKPMPVQGVQGGGELCQQLEGKLEGKKNKDSSTEFGSANSKEKLVTRWLHTGVPGAPHGAPQGPPLVAPPGHMARRVRAAAAPGVRKGRKQPQIMLVPAHPASTMGRMPQCVMMPPRYATLPLPPPAPYAHAHPPTLYYPVHDTRIRRRRSPREQRGRRRRDRGDSQLTRSLERIHRKRRADNERISDAELKRTYTGLDRAYAEQFIAVCDESRHAAEHHDSLASSSSAVTTDSHAS